MLSFSLIIFNAMLHEDNNIFHLSVSFCLSIPFLPPVTLPGALLAPVSSSSASLTTRRSSSNSSSSMQTSYRLPNPLPPLPVRKGVRGRRPKSQTIALLKAAAEAAAAAAVNGASQSPARTSSEAQLAPRPHKKRGPKPRSKVRCHRSCNLLCCGPVTLSFYVYMYYGRNDFDKEEARSRVGRLKEGRVCVDVYSQRRGEKSFPLEAAVRFRV